MDDHPRFFIQMPLVGEKEKGVLYRLHWWEHHYPDGFVVEFIGETKP